MTPVGTGSRSARWRWKLGNVAQAGAGLWAELPGDRQDCGAACRAEQRCCHCRVFKVEMGRKASVSDGSYVSVPVQLMSSVPAKPLHPYAKSHSACFGLGASLLFAEEVE